MIIKRSIVFCIYLYVTVQNNVFGLVIKLQVDFRSMHMMNAKVKDQIVGV